MIEQSAAQVSITKLRLVGFGALVLGAMGCIAAFGLSRSLLLQCYLFAFVFWFGLTLGCLGLTMLHHMMRGRWTRTYLRIWEAGNKNLLLMLVLFVPILAAVATHRLYPWALPASALAGQHSLQVSVKFHHAYFALPFFLIRCSLYFAVWAALTLVVNRSSARQDRTRDWRLQENRAGFSAVGLVVHIIMVTLAFTDLVMSLDPRWSSTIFGLWFVVGQGLAAAAFTAIVVMPRTNLKPYSDAISEDTVRDLGNTLLTLTMFWGYFSLSQWLIIYSGNLPDEISYYINRGLAGNQSMSAYWAIGTVILFGQFFVPFLCLLSGRAKRTPKILLLVAAEIFAIRILDLFWTIMPFFHPDSATPLANIYWIAASTWLLVGGIWLIGFVANVVKLPVLPAWGPEVIQAEELAHHA